ncbi:hypothetical protein B0G74_3838 [Paraburkholderia sp. BL9I2N2]|nr:hypothetical protein B0G74_3838 [Paraburkholderia sp. BL9I2N2]
MKARGLHLPIILLCSAEHNHDEFIAKQIGEYWGDVVTEGTGDYWNSNKTELRPGYEKRGQGIGVGQINRDDTEKRKALRTNLLYLAKAEQYLMIKAAERIRTFGTVHVPHKVKSGRPRVDSGMRSSEPCRDVRPLRIQPPELQAQVHTGGSGHATFFACGSQ